MVDAFIEIAIEKLVGLGEDELKLLCGTSEEAEKLSFTLKNMIRPCLHDAEVRQFNEPEVGAWLKTLKYVAYEADDVLDQWQTKSQQQSTGANLVWNFFAQCTCFRQLALRHTVGKKIQKINGKLDDIDTQSKKFNFLKSANVMGKGTNFPSVIRNARQTTSSVEEIFGREYEINGLKDMLINSSETSKLAVVSIVAPAGYGKTTLAKSVFNDDEVKQHFKQRIWVCVSDEFDEESIMRKMIEAATTIAPSIVGNRQALMEKLNNEVLKDKLFLLVLDDVWNEDYVKWKNLFNDIENCGLRGSWIVVTTRTENVCNVIDGHRFPLRFISSFEHSWSIFESVAFGSKNISKPPELKEVGQEIVKKCKGVPLAIKTIAGALRNNNREDVWKIVLKSNMWDWQPKEKTGILPALLLSYYHLSPPLKQCFQYCAIYPKDYDISKDEIVPQWIAQGYISEKKDMEMEDVAGNYFDELVALSLFQEPKLDEYKNIMHYKMHDLVHDLAQYVTKGEFLHINKEENIEFDAQYPPLHCNVSNMDKIDIGNFLKLRTFMFTSYEREVRMCDSQIEEMRHLRVLELKYWRHHELPEVVGKLMHLRYLKLWGQNLKALPSSIGKLQNLLYLDLSETSIEALPESVELLRKLRHLDLSRNENLKALPSTIGCLTNLRKLDLRRTRLDEISSSIGELQNLLYLKLTWNENLIALPSTIGKLTNLRKLDLKGTGLDEIPDCIGKLASLQVLDVSCCNLEKLPESIKDLSRLQVLDVSDCQPLKNLQDGLFDKMMGLKELYIMDSGLRGLPAGIGKLTCLQSLEYFWVAGNHDGSSSSSSSNIWELGDLDHLQGSLTISNLDVVTSGEEASRAQLHNKNFLSRLALEWNTDGRGGAKEKTSEDVLQALRPCPTLLELRIEGYPGCTVPTWLGNPTALMLSGLQKLTLYNWDGCANLPALGNFPELRRLEIRNMPKVRRVGAEWSGSDHAFPKLEVLQFWFMMEWEEWDILEEKPLFPCLSELHISYCPKLRSLPPIFSTSPLREIHVDECPNLEEKSFFPCLSKLEIRNSPKLQSLPSLPNLECLVIAEDDGVSELSNDLVNKFGALKRLYIEYCPNLESLPKEMASLKQLQKLVISSCGKLRSLPSLPNLEHLTIGGDDGLSELSNDLVNKLGALKTLVIENCPNLESLPQEMASLKQLQTLATWRCPKLIESCNKDGAQWYMIQHIPSIWIDHEDVRRNA